MGKVFHSEATSLDVRPFLPLTISTSLLSWRQHHYNSQNWLVHLLVFWEILDISIAIKTALNYYNIKQILTKHLQFYILG